ncbi:MAG: cytochrome c oxidase subunit II [Chloroflexi bacterium]|nr:cytochrome c oxidase subunit II [Chloroflexota bacterium]
MSKHFSKKLVGVLLLVIVTGLLAGCYPDHPQSTFDAHGPVAESQLNLFYLIFGVAALVFVIVEGILLFTAFRFRRKPGDGDPYQNHGNTPLELSWTALPVVLLAIVAVPTIQTIFDNANSPLTPEQGGMVIDAVGVQWWFEFRYQDPTDPSRTIITANEMHIPQGEVVNVNLRSRDVIHSFWIPKIAGKVDMVPNNPNQMWIRADSPGVFLGQCAEFCGESHALMRFRVVVHPTVEEFEQWLINEGSPAEAPRDPLAIRGQEIFEGDAQCWACHTVLGTDRARGRVGPSLTHFASRTHIAAGLMENNQENLRKWISHPGDVKPGNIMARDARAYNDPEFQLSEEEISALVRYLQTLR